MNRVVSNLPVLALDHVLSQSGEHEVAVAALDESLLRQPEICSTVDREADKDVSRFGRKITMDFLILARSTSSRSQELSTSADI